MCTRPSTIATTSSRDHEENKQAATAGTSPTSTVSSATTSHHHPPKLDASCRSCARLVQEILQNPNSRPRQVLQSLIGGLTSAGSRHYSGGEQPSFSLKPVEDGVQVEMRVPDKPYVLPQRWMRVAPRDNTNQQPSHQNDLQQFVPRPPVLATSAAPPVNGHPYSSYDDDDDHNSRQSQHAQQKYKYITETIKIECRPCDTVGPEQGARALIMGPTPLSIVACTNRLTPGDREEMSQVLVHELLHAYDVKRLNLDFTDCESMAYSEVRAAREAECFTAANTTWQGPSFLKEYCVKQKAIAATHNLFPSQGRKCVRAVFATAYQDPRPFQEAELQSYVQRTYVQQQSPPSSAHNNNNNNNNNQHSSR